MRVVVIEQVVLTTRLQLDAPEMWAAFGRGEDPRGTEGM